MELRAALEELAGRLPVESVPDVLVDRGG